MQRIGERKLVQWAIAYLAGAWVVLEAFAFVADRFGWPPMLVRGATIVLALGFLVALVLAWYHGEQGRQDVSRAEMVLIAAVVAAAGILLPVFAPAGPGPKGGSVRLSVAHGSATARFFVLLPDGETLKATEPALAISSDGSKLAFAAGRGDTTRLYVRAIGSFEATPIPGTLGARAPFFSPDGEWLGFFADRAVKKVSLRGGAPQTVVEGAWTARWESTLSGSWGADDVLLLSYPGHELGSSIWRVAASGGAPRRVTTQSWRENQHLPQQLPDGKHVLASSWNVDGTTKVLVVSLETGEQRVVVQPGTDARYLDSGHLVYVVGEDLYAVTFDAGKLEVTGRAVPVVEGMLTGEYGTAQFAVSKTGTLVYVPAGVEDIERTLVWVDSSGVVDPVPDSRMDAYTPRISPDGSRVVFQQRPSGALWLMDLRRGSRRPVPALADGITAWWHVWTPDGNGLVFNADLHDTGWLNLYEVSVGSSGAPRRLTARAAHQQPQGWSADGRLLVYTEGPDPVTNVDIWTMPVPRDWTAEVDRTPRPFLRTRASEFHPAMSPDGRWMAYASDASGRWEVYVAPYPGPGSEVQVSMDGGSEPSWSPDGRTLYYRGLGAHNIARQMMAVPVLASAAFDDRRFRSGAARILFDGPYYQCSEWGRSYDLAPDGSRFLMIHDQRPDLAATQLNVVVNWFAELPS